MQPRILLCVDSQTSLNAAAAALRADGYNVIVADSVASATSLAHLYRPQLIVADSHVGDVVPLLGTSRKPEIPLLHANIKALSSQQLITVVSEGLTHSGSRSS